MGTEVERPVGRLDVAGRSQSHVTRERHSGRAGPALVLECQSAGRGERAEIVDVAHPQGEDAAIALQRVGRNHPAGRNFANAASQRQTGSAQGNRARSGRDDVERRIGGINHRQRTARPIGPDGTAQSDVVSAAAAIDGNVTARTG